MTPKQIREAAATSLAVVAVRARCSPPTASRYELAPDAVRDPRCRARLEQVYRELAELAASPDADGPRAA